MCFVDKDLPGEFPPLGLHDVPAVAGVVALALAAVLIILLFAPQRSQWIAVQSLTVASDTAVEPRNVWR